MPEVRNIRNASLVRAEKGKIGIEVEVQVENPNAFVIRLVKLKGEIFLDGKSIGSGKSSKKVRIPRNSNDYHIVTLETDANLLQIIMGNMKSSGQLRIIGEGTAGAFIIRKKFKFDHQERVQLMGGW